jgi:hypothetical protein
MLRMCLLALPLVACAGGQTPHPDQRYSASYSGFDQPARLVVRDAAAWQAFWEQMYVGYLPQPPLPAVDFSNQMVIAAAMGKRSSGGFTISIENVSPGAEVLVKVVSTSPGPCCGRTLAVTQPVDVVVVPRSDAPVRFEERAETRDCC